MINSALLDKDIETWINEDPRLKEYLMLAKEYYKGPIQFKRSGKKVYSAKLDTSKLKIKVNAKEAYFDLNLNKKRNNTYKDFFYLRIIDVNKDVNCIKLF